MVARDHGDDQESFRCFIHIRMCRREGLPS
jgi:hypothetical protein